MVDLPQFDPQRRQRPSRAFAIGQGGKGLVVADFPTRSCPEGAVHAEAGPRAVKRTDKPATESRAYAAEQTRLDRALAMARTGFLAPAD